MASQPPPPPKPWETRRIPGAGPGPGPGPTFQSADLGPTLLTRPGQPTLTRVPPPILPRPSQQTKDGQSQNGNQEGLTCRDLRQWLLHHNSLGC